MTLIGVRASDLFRPSFMVPRRRSVKSWRTFNEAWAKVLSLRVKPFSERTSMLSNTP
ncbi:hypothetical protein D3C72_1152680 [compost metagenome]